MLARYNIKYISAHTQREIELLDVIFLRLSQIENIVIESTIT